MGWRKWVELEKTNFPNVEAQFSVSKLSDFSRSDGTVISCIVITMVIFKAQKNTEEAGGQFNILNSCFKLFFSNKPSRNTKLSDPSIPLCWRVWVRRAEAIYWEFLNKDNSCKSVHLQIHWLPIMIKLWQKVHNQLNMHPLGESVNVFRGILNFLISWELYNKFKMAVIKVKVRNLRVSNFLLDSVGEGESGMFQENSIKTYII